MILYKEVAIHAIKKLPYMKGKNVYEKEKAAVP